MKGGGGVGQLVHLFFSIQIEDVSTVARSTMQLNSFIGDEYDYRVVLLTRQSLHFCRILVHPKRL